MINYGVASFIVSEAGVKTLSKDIITGYKKLTCVPPSDGSANLCDLRERLGMLNPPIYKKVNQDIYAIKVNIKNAYNNLRPIYISEEQFVIRDWDELIYPRTSSNMMEYSTGEYIPLFSSRFLDSGEEFSGYIFFDKTSFNNPILEINPFRGSFPIRVRLNQYNNQ